MCTLTVADSVLCASHIVRQLDRLYIGARVRDEIVIEGRSDRLFESHDGTRIARVGNIVAAVRVCITARAGRHKDVGPGPSRPCEHPGEQQTECTVVQESHAASVCGVQLEVRRVKPNDRMFGIQCAASASAVHFTSRAHRTRADLSLHSFLAKYEPADIATVELWVLMAAPPWSALHLTNDELEMASGPYRYKAPPGGTIRRACTAVRSNDNVPITALSAVNTWQTLLGVAVAKVRLGDVERLDRVQGPAKLAPAAPIQDGVRKTR